MYRRGFLSLAAASLLIKKDSVSAAEKVEGGIPIPSGYAEYVAEAYRKAKERGRLTGRIEWQF